MNSRWLMTAALALGLALNPVGTHMEFAPAGGVQLEKSFEGTFSAFIEDLMMTMNGEEMPFGLDSVDPSEREGEFGYSLEVIDVFNSVDGGRVTDLLRTYNSIEGHVEGGGESEDKSFEDLEGQSIHFVWDDEAETYTRSVQDEDSELEEDLVRSLAVDLDMAALLPDGEVSTGDSWEVPGQVLAGLLIPGIDFAAASEMESEDAPEIPAELLDTLEASMEEAIIECSFDGLSGDGDNELALITFTLVSDLSIDAADIVADQIDFGEAEVDMDLDELTIDVSLELEGELLWNVRGGHFASYEVTGEVTLDAYLIMAVGGGQMEIEGEAEASLEFSVEGLATVL